MRNDDGRGFGLGFGIHGKYVMVMKLVKGWFYIYFI